MITQITSEQINQVVADGQFKYIKLTGTDGKEFGGWNRFPKDLNNKITSIRNHIKNLPSGQYFIHFKISPTKDEWKYLLTKGEQNNLSQNSPQPVIIHQGSALEKFQTLEEWKSQEIRIKELEKELELLKMQNAFRDQLNEKPEENPIQGFTTNILPQFVPLFDRFMSLQEKKLELAQKQPIRTNPSQPQPKPFRPAPNPDSQLWESYLDYLDAMNDIRYQRELLYLKSKQPDVYQYVIDATTEIESQSESENHEE